MPKTKRKTAQKRDAVTRVDLAIGEIDGLAVAVEARVNPRARRVIVKVHPSTGVVTLVASTRRGLDAALDLARREKDWIARQLARVPKPVCLTPGASLPFRGRPHRICAGAGKGPAPVWQDEKNAILWVHGRPEHAARRVADFLKRAAREACEEKLLDCAALLGVKASRITMRDPASRWGSCSSSRAISFSWRLILAPDFVRDYVVAHEAAHLREMNHGPRFWALVRKLSPDHKAAQAWLRQHGPALQRYAPRGSL